MPLVEGELIACNATHIPNCIRGGIEQEKAEPAIPRRDGTTDRRESQNMVATAREDHAALSIRGPTISDEPISGIRQESANLMSQPALGNETSGDVAVENVPLDSDAATRWACSGRASSSKRCRG